MTWLAIVRRRWLVATACVAAGAIGALGSTRDATPIYEARTRLYVNLPRASEIQEALQGVQLSAQLMKSYAEIATSRRAASQIAASSGVQSTEDEILAMLSATPVPETLLLSITARHPDPRSAQRLAATAGSVFADLVAELELGDSPGAQPRVIDLPQLPETPVSPRPLANLALGLSLGLAGGLLVSWMLEALDRSVRAPAEAVELAAAPLLGIVPRRRNAAKQVVVAGGVEASPGAEAFRIIRTGVRFVNLDAPLRSLVVTSPSVGDGKTTTAANLAVALAEGGERVVLVDTDLRRPRVASAFGLSLEDGLMSVVLGQAEPESVMIAVNDRLRILGPGPIPPNPSEILGSSRMASIIAQLVGSYDKVLFDTPPLLAVTDAEVLTSLTDGALMVVREGRTRRSSVAEARQRLDVVGANLFGLVVIASPAHSEYASEYAYTSGGSTKPARPRSAPSWRRLRLRSSG